MHTCIETPRLGLTWTAPAEQALRTSHWLVAQAKPHSVLQLSEVAGCEQVAAGTSLNAWLAGSVTQMHTAARRAVGRSQNTERARRCGIFATCVSIRYIMLKEIEHTLEAQVSSPMLHWALSNCHFLTQAFGSFGPSQITFSGLEED